MWRGHWLDAAAAELAIRGCAVKRRHLSDDAKRLVWRRRRRRESTAGAGERSRHRQRQAACASEPPHGCVGGLGSGAPCRSRIADTEARGAGPGEEGRQAVSMTDGTAGGLGAAALTGGALVMQGGGEWTQVAAACRRSRADGVTGLGWREANGPTTSEEHAPQCRSYAQVEYP